MTTGWMIGVLVDVPGEAAPLRHYFAIAREDLNLAEWAAADAAMLVGRIASSPLEGVEPVQAVQPLPAATIRDIGLAPGQLKALGSRWPRKWLRR